MFWRVPRPVPETETGRDWWRAGVVEMARREAGRAAARARARRGVRLGRIIFVSWVWDVVFGSGFLGGDGKGERREGLYKSSAEMVWIDAL
jgi:hypothetical protein